MGHGLAIALHVLFAVIWVGGMFFSYVVLRPSMVTLDDAARTRLWAQVLSRFFPFVLIAIPVMLGSGLYMIYGEGDDLMHEGPHVQIMFGLAILMMLLFLHTFFSPFRKLRRAAAASDTPAALKQVRMIRMLVGINLLLGLTIVLVATGGKYILG